MFITLTQAEDTKPCHLRAAAVVGVTPVDRFTTNVVLMGGGEVLVRETPARIMAAVRDAELGAAMGARPVLSGLRTPA